MALPREILEHIAHYLSANDQYRCLNVCQAWYHAFLYFLYRFIRISTNEQVNQLYYALRENTCLGPLVRGIALEKEKMIHFGMGTHLKEIESTQITQELLDIVDQRCIYIEELDFDQSQWSILNRFPLHLLFRLKRLPTLNFSDMRIFMKSTTTDGHPYRFEHLNQLRIRGNDDMFQGSSPLLKLLSFIPQLTTLVLERDDVQNKYKTPILTLEHLESIHRNLPELQDLRFVNHFNYGISTYYLHNSDTIIVSSHPKLRRLTLEGTLQSYQWIQHISKAYPSLEHIHLDLVHSPYSNPSTMEIVPMQYLNYKIKKAFQRIAAHCPQLCSVNIRGLSTPLWLTSKFMSIQSSKPVATDMNVQFYGLDSDGVERCLALLSEHKTPPHGHHLNLTGLRLPIWKKKVVNGNGQNAMSWRETIQPLRSFHSLTRLELDAVSMAFIDGNHEDGFELDTLLRQLIHLQSLKLSGSLLQLSDEDPHDSEQFGLTELILHRMFFSPKIMTYMSGHCLGLKRLIMYDCQQNEIAATDNKARITINLDHLMLDLIVLYRVRHPFQFAQSRTPGARFMRLNDTRWFHVVVGEASVCKAVPVMDPKKISIIQHSGELQLLEEWDPDRVRYHTENEWLEDLTFGYIDICCQAAKKIFLDECLI